MPRNQGTSRKGKPKKHERAAGMGRALQKSRGRKHIPSASTGGMAMRQGVDSINIEKEDNRASVLQLNDLDDFLIQAEMANRDFVSEKERFVVLDSTTQAHEYEEERVESVSWDDRAIKGANTFAFQELSVPRRPAWDETTTAQELDAREKEAFLEWRRAIALKEEEIALKGHAGLGVTPFEKNLEIWRQLWRVMERCSCIVQIVDARNPLFYLSKDLRKYATEELGKPMILLVNKSDYLSPRQRQAWHEYFSLPEHQWDHVFFSAHEQQKILDEASEPTDSAASSDTATPPSATSDIGVDVPLSRQGLISWLMEYAAKYNCDLDTKYGRIPFGMVGFPNVGKSSVINVLMGNAKHAHGVTRVGVAAMPGKTKHFQTLLLPDRDDILLCDCPGLVFPSFVNNTADLIAAGVYPIAQMRDPWPVMNLLCRRIPREVLNAQYGIQIPMPTADSMLQVKDGTIPPPTAEEFLNTYCVARSLFAASSGVPDVQRASRMIIKEYATGKLLYCHSPPDFDYDDFQKETMLTAIQNTKKLREKLGAIDALVPGDNGEASASVVSDESDDEKPNDVDLDAVDDDDMLFELMGEPESSNQSAAKPGKKKKWGKKGRKLRNKDPYGCHSTPDDSLGGSSTAVVGVSVSAGKYGKKGYTRPTTYSGARSVA
ncbi:unnamed protein product [Cylindrotheca closterium]|uniref:G domain-containing protein n=1 Tax=Cylindrotheca closterium TaxID=2856 RepID=A0AAD2FGR5_9STRA|nr:unnamed protein product [Cylindrotheca closterium]